MCGAGGAVPFTFKRVTGKLLMFTVEEFPGRWCRHCGRSAGRMAQNHTLVFGWFGFIAPFISAVIVVANSIGLIRVGRSESVANERTSDPGRPIWLRTGPAISVAVISLLVFVISASPNTRRISDLQPGDCVNDDWGTANMVQDTELISCDDPHDFETFATVLLGKQDEP
ncbi:MAG: hypothetical protein ACR2NL_05740, partial [Acidimicrobiia bacterium]